MKDKQVMEKAILRLAALIENGELIAETDPTEFLNIAADQITQLTILADTNEEYLNNLLAVIHRDGGHHTGYVGTEQSVADAMHIVTETRGRAEEAEAKLIERDKTIESYLPVSQQKCGPILPSLFIPSTCAAPSPSSDHWIGLSEAGKPKSLEGCGCQLNGECAIKGDWYKGESSSCDECRYQIRRVKSNED